MPALGQTRNWRRSRRMSVLHQQQTSSDCSASSETCQSRTSLAFTCSPGSHALRSRTYTAKTFTHDQSTYQALSLCPADELVHYREGVSVVLGHSNRHLNEIKAPIKNNGTGQLRRN